MNITGKDVIPALAEVYQQLYLVPGDEGAEAYKKIVRSGKDASVKSLEHFHMSDKDSCRMEKTPAGDVMVVTLNDRHDFELFLQIMAECCVKTEIPPSQGASIIDGIVNWSKINAHKDEFYGKNPDAGWFEWNVEFKSFQEDKSNYTETMIVLSVGPYSAVPAERAGFGEAEWLDRSQTIRMYHECTHFLCRRLFPGQTDAVWDELVADAAGIYAALGIYDMELEEMLLGITGGKYTGGRLENYVVKSDPDTMDNTAKKIHSALRHFAEISAANPETGPFDFALLLQNSKEEMPYAMML